jgi:hypothetical protein
MSIHGSVFEAENAWFWMGKVIIYGCLYFHLRIEMYKYYGPYIDS